ncbi:hypothetical protein N032_26225 [Pseudomonas syringae pv. pisi str. PP1]|nr:hypothetical protein N032_26225 [Pseudomonas syringae pv. pisi str. PP1]
MIRSRNGFPTATRGRRDHPHSAPRARSGRCGAGLASTPQARRYASPLRPYGLWLACLIAAACVAGLITSHARGPKALAVPPVVQSIPETRTVDAEAQPVAAADPAPAHIRKTAELVPIAATVAPPAPVQPLDDCMKNGNVIDEAVANCRFGQLPRPAQAEPATGMVSADYMADFKANASRNSTRSSRPYSVATASIREADGRNRYRAQWRVYGNTIDGDSVCENFAIRSFERRECRKAAAVNFREECREWTKRAARNRDEDSKNAQQRYCEVTANFSP